MEAEETQQIALPYKFRELKIYSSTEWLADNRKKYRQVFDRNETTFVYAELSFYNKLFDEEAWDVTITLKCFALGRSKKEICNLELKKKISKYDHTVYVRSVGLQFEIVGGLLFLGIIHFLDVEIFGRNFFVIHPCFPIIGTTRPERALFFIAPSFPNVYSVVVLANFFL